MCTNGCQDPYELPTGAQGPAGADGIQGLTGPTGADGTQGTAGADGTNGADGNDGSDGNDGLQGTSFRQGVGVPSNSIGTVGDSYVDLNSDDLRIYTRGTTFWTNTGIGLKGADGDSGTVFKYIERDYSASDISIALSEQDVVTSLVFSSPLDSTPGNINQNAARVAVTFNCTVVSANEGANAVLTLKLFQGTSEMYQVRETVSNDGSLSIVSFTFMLYNFTGVSGELIKVTAISSNTQFDLENIEMVILSNSVTS